MTAAVTATLSGVTFDSFFNSTTTPYVEVTNTARLVYGLEIKSTKPINGRLVNKTGLGPCEVFTPSHSSCPELSKF
jgi:hypothetical protein